MKPAPLLILQFSVKKNCCSFIPHILFVCFLILSAVSSTSHFQWWFIFTEGPIHSLFNFIPLVSIFHHRNFRSSTSFLCSPSFRRSVRQLAWRSGIAEEFVSRTMQSQMSPQSKISRSFLKNILLEIKYHQIKKECFHSWPGKWIGVSLSKQKQKRLLIILHPLQLTYVKIKENYRQGWET